MPTVGNFEIKKFEFDKKQTLQDLANELAAKLGIKVTDAINQNGTISISVNSPKKAKA